MSANEDQKRKDMESFEAWKIKYNRKYATSDEDDMRFKIFQGTLRKIEAVKEYGLNKFSDLTGEEFINKYCCPWLTDSDAEEDEDADKDEDEDDVKHKSDHEYDTKEEVPMKPK